MSHPYSSLLLVLSALVAPSAALAADQSGTVFDQSGRAVPRAYVRVIDAAGGESAAGFADEAGRFRLTTSESNCRVEATLTGFAPATAPCATSSTSGPLRLVLAVAPVREDVIVSATRTEAPLGQVGASATVFTAEDLESRQMPLVADLLRSSPGAMLVRYGAPGTVTSLFVRGGESDYNKILLDGVPLNEPGGTFYLNNLTTENLERVEVVRGAYSSLFGSDAMASVVQLFTRRADGASRRPQGSVQVDGGTYGTLHLSTAIAGASGRLDYSLGAARLATDNRVPNNRLENTTLSGNVGIRLGGSATLRFVGRGELEHVGTPGTTAFGRPDLDAFFERHDAVGAVTFDQQATADLRQRASYSLTRSTQQSTNLVEDAPYTPRYGDRVGVFDSFDFLNDSRNEFRRHHASYQADWRLPRFGRARHLFTLLADWDGERATLANRLAGTSTVHARDNFGVSAEHQALWRRLFVTVGGRIEHNDSFGTAVVPRASVVLVAHEGSGAIGDTRLKASAGRGIKEPTLLESFSLSPFFLGNPGLKPERSRSAEVGIDQRFAGDRAKVGLTWFDNRFSDVISLVTTDPETYSSQYSNVGVTRARGLEIGADAAPTASLRARGGYTFLDSEILKSATPDSTVFGLGRAAFWRPRHSGFVGLTTHWKRARVDVDGVFVGQFVDSDFGTFDRPLAENPGHTTWNARVTLTLTRRLTGTLLMDNLTGKDYSAPFGYQPLLRVIRAGLKLSF